MLRSQNEWSEFDNKRHELNQMKCTERDGSSYGYTQATDANNTRTNTEAKLTVSAWLFSCDLRGKENTDLETGSTDRNGG